MAASPNSTAPMEAQLADSLPEGDGWLFEPKWDGFRCLARRFGSQVHIISKSGKPLGRYFPDIEQLLGEVKGGDFLLDGELLIPAGESLSFEELQLRLHPAASRVAKLAAAHPAELMLFDLLELGGVDHSTKPLAERREALERLMKTHKNPRLKLSPATTKRTTALRWLKRSGGALDGVMAKRVDQPYRQGERAMIKVKQRRTADCVVGGFRYASKSKEVGSLLLGLYGGDGLLHHVGFTSAIPAKDRPRLTRDLEKLKGGAGFTGKAPGGTSRWSSERSAQWVAVRPKMVAEVRYDQITSRRFRHGTAFLRWRPDKAPEQCTFDQLAPALDPAKLEALFE